MAVPPGQVRGLVSEVGLVQARRVAEDEGDLDTGPADAFLGALEGLAYVV